MYNMNYSNFLPSLLPLPTSCKYSFISLGILKWIICLIFGRLTPVPRALGSTRDCRTVFWIPLGVFECYMAYIPLRELSRSCVKNEYNCPQLDCDQSVVENMGFSLFIYWKLSLIHVNFPGHFFTTNLHFGLRGKIVISFVSFVYNGF